MKLSHTGPRVGDFLGRPIYESIINNSGTWIFDRIARSIDGEFPLEQLKNGERLFDTGLIYRIKA